MQHTSTRRHRAHSQVYWTYCDEQSRGSEPLQRRYVRGSASSSVTVYGVAAFSSLRSLRTMLPLCSAAFIVHDSDLFLHVALVKAAIAVPFRPALILIGSTC